MPLFSDQNNVASDCRWLGKVIECSQWKLGFPCLVYSTQICSLVKYLDGYLCKTLIMINVSGYLVSS